MENQGTRTNVLYLQILNVQLREATIHATAPDRYHLPPQSTRELIISSRQAGLAFIATALINFLQLKFQGKSESPFEANPNTMMVAVASLFIYCLSYDAQLRLSQTSQGDRRHVIFPVRQGFIRISVAIFGPLSLASISSVLFPEKFGPLLYLAAFIYSFSEFSVSEMKRTWNWIHRRPDQPPGGGGRRRRGGRTTVSVLAHRFPPLHSMMDQVDIFSGPPV